MYTVEQAKLYLNGFENFARRFGAYPHEVDIAAAPLCDAIKNPAFSNDVRETLIKGVIDPAADTLKSSRAAPQVFDRFVETLFDIATPFEQRPCETPDPVAEMGVVALTALALNVQNTHPKQTESILTRLNRLDQF